EAIACERMVQRAGSAVPDQHAVRRLDPNDSLPLRMARQVPAEALDVGQLGHAIGLPALGGGAGACAQRSQPGPIAKIAAIASPATISAPARRVCVNTNAANHSGQTGKR